MKKYILLLGLFLAFGASAWAQDNTEDDVVLNNNLPTCFNYQALIYADGKPVAETDIKLRITLQDQEKAYLVEEHSAKTTKTGWVEVLVGSQKPDDMLNIPWEKNLLVKVEVDLGSGTYISLGEPVKMEPVPYALFARTAPIIRGNGDAEAPIFQVRNSHDLPIFSVYEDAISMNVTEVPAGTRRPRGGFAVKSFRTGDDGAEQATRLSLNDGAFSVYVDPVTRRPRGGFAVKTLKTDLRADSEPETLFSMDERATYFTIDQCQVGSTFQFRDRDEESEIIMNLQNGYIQSVKGSNKADVIEKLPDPATATTALNWFMPGEDAVLPTPVNLEFTNLTRWRIPEFKVDGNVVPYHIAILDRSPNNSGKNLSDYFTVGKIIRCTATTGLPTEYVKHEAEALMLKSDVKLEDDEYYPSGDIVISWAEYPDVKQIVGLYTAGKILAHTDKLKLEAVKIEQINYTDKALTVSMTTTELTQDAYWPEIAHNMPFKVEVVDPNFANFLKVANRDGKLLYLTIADNEDFYKAVTEHGTLRQGYEIKVKMKATFPNAIYPDVNFDLTLWVKKKD